MGWLEEQIGLVRVERNIGKNELTSQKWGPENIFVLNALQIVSFLNRLCFEISDYMKKIYDL